MTDPDAPVELIYIGPHESGTTGYPYHDGIAFERGKPVTVPYWLAYGQAGEPGVVDFGDGPEEFTGNVIGGIVLQERILPTAGLLADPSSWKLAEPPSPDTEGLKAKSPKVDS